MTTETLPSYHIFIKYKMKGSRVFQTIGPLPDDDYASAALKDVRAWPGVKAAGIIRRQRLTPFHARKPGRY